MNIIYPIVLSGGGGTRLWPKSRPDRPKPFQNLIGEQTFFQSTLARLDEAGFASPRVVSGEAHTGLISQQSNHGQLAELIVEPAAKNTAPAIALAAARLDPDAVMLVCPSDHHISDEPAFRNAVQAAARLAEAGWLVTLGIDPTGPETGFGYIERGDDLGSGGFKVRRFVEKPDEKTAGSFVKRGTFSWNSGIFIFTAGQFLRELERHRPEMAQSIRESVAGGQTEGGKFHPASVPFEAIKGESIDYAVMENAEKVAVIPVSMGWSDIGNWQALRDAQTKDNDGNAALGRAELVDCKDVFVMSDGARVSVVGLEDVIIVVDGGEVLVIAAKDAQKVGQLKGAKDL